ncbi:uncharacterized protein LOC121368692 [Gigantopelta aegis]|uniref:uncharacterized protein LOC121368692 n=1 Tax=Gigantopelta aegis TaxID=1735272 RepID=UPI001B88B017|nr:uncharacterized protein LOC121368692 [Gigantopelta aegis]
MSSAFWIVLLLSHSVTAAPTSTLGNVPNATTTFGKTPTTAATSTTTTSTTTTATSTTTMVTTTKMSTTTTPVTTVKHSDCIFESATPHIRDTLNSLLTAGAKLVEYDVKFDVYDADVLTSNGGNLFRPYHWVRTSNRQGKTLLLLDHNYDVLSLSTLRLGVETMNVTLRTIPRGCIHGMSAEERMTGVRELLLNDFKRPDFGGGSGSLTKDNFVCNMYARNEGGYANFLYQCCHKDPDGVTVCQDMIRNIWINVLLACIIVIKVLVVLFSPSFVPEDFYRKKFTEADYVYHCPDKKQLKIVATRHPDSTKYPKKIVKSQCLFGMDNFQTMISNMHVDKVYQVTFDKIHLAVKARRLLPEKVVPVSVIKVIFENIFRCKLRNLDPLNKCCETNIYHKLNLGFKEISWYKCLRILANLVLMFIFVLPWLVRIIIFYSYEASHVDEKHTAAKQMKVKTQFEGSFTMYLTPLHGIFIVTYFILVFDSLFYGILKKKMKDKFKYVLRESLLDMREKSRLKKIIAKFKSQKSEKMTADKKNLKLNSLEKSSMSKCEIFFQIVIVLMCLTSFWSSTFLLMECVSFFVELVVYTMMGIIVNAGTTLQYLTVLFLLFIYAKDTFSSVHKKYLNFYKVIFNFLLTEKNWIFRQLHDRW